MLETRGFKELEFYTKEVTGLGLERFECESPRLPMHIMRTFEFVCAALGSAELVFALAQPWANVTPASAEKQVPQIERAFGRRVVFVLPDLPAWARRDFIARGVPFITPHRQMFLPNLAMDYRDKVYRKVQDGESGAHTSLLTPGEQQVLLYMLLSPGMKFQAAQVLTGLGVSSMTISRAFRTLQKHGLIDRPAKGRERPALLRQEKMAIWIAAQQSLRNPVLDSAVLRTRNVPFPEAGLTALARATILAAPPFRTVATSKAGWQRWQRLQGDVALTGKVNPEVGEVLVQVWAYDPGPLSRSGVVDPLSLYLSFRESQDERISMARDEVVEAIEWN